MNGYGWFHKLQICEESATKHLSFCRRHHCISQQSRISGCGVVCKQALIDCIGWLANVPSQLNILGFPWPISTFSYSGCCFTLGSSDALIPKLASLMAQSVMSQGQLKHGSLIRLRLIRMVLALSISERGTELFKICNNNFKHLLSITFLPLCLTFLWGIY